MNDEMIMKKLVESSIWRARMSFLASTIFRDWYIITYDSLSTRRNSTTMPEHRRMIKKTECPNPNHKHVKLKLKGSRYSCPECGLAIEKKRLDKMKSLYKKAPEAASWKFLDKEYESRAKGLKEPEKKKVIDHLLNLYKEADKEAFKSKDKILKEIKDLGLEVYQEGQKK